jgi:hypothetical protein
MSWYLQIEIPVDYVQWTNLMERDLPLILTICIYRRMRDCMIFSFSRPWILRLRYSEMWDSVVLYVGANVSG